MNPKIIELSIYLAILGALIGFWQWDRHQAYEQGYLAHESETNNLANDTAVENAERLGEELKKLKEEKKKWIEKEPKTTTIVKALGDIKYVYRNIEKQVFVCNDLGDNFANTFYDNRVRIFSDKNVSDTDK